MHSSRTHIHIYIYGLHINFCLWLSPFYMFFICLTFCTFKHIYVFYYIKILWWIFFNKSFCMLVFTKKKSCKMLLYTILKFEFQSFCYSNLLAIFIFQWFYEILHINAYQINCFLLFKWLNKYFNEINFDVNFSLFISLMSAMHIYIRLISKSSLIKISGVFMLPVKYDTHYRNVSGI